MKVDIVIPYVDNKNKEWQEKYFTYFDKCNDTFYRTNKDFLRFLLRSIDKNLSWVNNVFLVVQNCSEVPNYVNTDKVKVVTHDMFIPKEYLPTFNSATIEMFLWNIPKLAEQFIYFNDDIFVMKPLSYDKFFVNNNVISHYFNRPIPNGYNSYIVQRSYKTAWGVSAKEMIEKRYISSFLHTCRPFFKSLIKECYNKNKTLINRWITRTRQGCNHSIYLFDEYIRFVGRNINQQAITLEKIINTDNNEQITQKFNSGYDTICLYEFSKTPNIFENKALINLLKTKFQNICKYENK